VQSCAIDDRLEIHGAVLHGGLPFQVSTQGRMITKASGGRDETGESAFRRTWRSFNVRTDSSNNLISASMARCRHSQEFAWVGFINTVAVSARAYSSIAGAVVVLGY
jgi:hypothetical protein